MLTIATAIPDFTSTQSQLTRSNYIHLVSFVILYYDYALTLPAEVDRFWSKRHISWGLALFYGNRYLSLFGHIPVIYQYFQYFLDARGSNSNKICSILCSYHECLSVTIQIIVGVFLVIRTYALYNRNKKVLTLTCVCGFAVLAFGAWSVISEHGSSEDAELPQINCPLPMKYNDAIHMAAVWTAVLSFDVLIVALTLYRSLGRCHDNPLFKVLLRDGVIYFGIIALVNLLNIISFLVLSGYDRGIITNFANILSSTMISRLMINLRHPKRYEGVILMSEHPVSFALRFNTFSSSTTTVSLGMQ